MRIVITIAAILLASLTNIANAQNAAPDRQAAFASEVDFNHLGRIAVHADGRLKSYGSHARSMMQFVSGPRSVRGQVATFTYLDLMLRPRAYEDAEIIYVKNKTIRDRVARALLRSVGEAFGPQGPHGEMGAELIADVEVRMDRFMKTGLISPLMLHDPLVAQAMAEMRQDLIRTARFVEEIENAIAASDAGVLRHNLRIVPPPGGGFHDRWLTMEEFAHIEHADPRAYASVDLAVKADLLSAWRKFQDSWHELNAPGVNAAAARLADLLPLVNPQLYEENVGRTGWPWTYTEASAWKWRTSVGLGILSGLLGIVLLVMRLPTAASLGMAGAAFIGMLHYGAYTLGQQNPLPLESWYFAWRNMTWVWLFYAISLVPLLLGVVFRWRGAHWVGMGMFFIAFALHTAALLVRWYVSGRWPNSNMFEAVTTAAWFGGIGAIALEIIVRRFMWGGRGMFAIGSAAASMVALMCAYFMPVQLDPNIRNMMPVLHDVWLYIHTNVIIFAYCLIFMAAVTGTLYLLHRLVLLLRDREGINEYARLGGAGSLIRSAESADGTLLGPRSALGTSLGQVLDGTTMILVELSFILLWAGTIMGAIWADHSWGRPWGWDPKEVFALNTFLVFAILIHVRLKWKDKGLWTAIIALIGAAVMLFNWIAINFVVTGLHSYA